MQLQTELGDRAGAVSTYHHCASVLERELGVAPDPATQREFQRLMAGAGPDGRRRPVTGPEVGRSGPVAVQLVGRAAELGLLRDVWRNAAAGRPGVVLVHGGAGVGKTRLVAEVAELAQSQGAAVASSQCFGASGRLALAPVADWLRNPAVQSVTATLEDAWRAEVDRLVPSGVRAKHAAGSRAMADAWQRHRFFEGLARALLAVGRPMLLVLDNAQWCDQETLAFVTFCLGLAPGAQLLIAGTVRDDHPDQDPVLRAWIETMRAAGLLTEVSLGPFEPADTARLAEAISRRPLLEADANLLQATTGGFPLYVIEAMRGTVDPGSAGDPGSTGRPAGNLTAVLRNRLEQASSAARDVAGLAAAVGTDFTLDLLTEASDLDADLVVNAVDELWRRRIMREFGAGYDFAHDLLRETAYAQVSPPRRWLLHRRVAQALELLHADDIDMVAALLAAQYARGGRPGRAVAYYRRAADVAAGVFAHDEAIRLHKEALSIPPAPPFPEELWGRKSCAILWCYTGPHDRADEVLEPVKTYGSPLLVGVQPMPFTVLQGAFDGLLPAGLQWYWRADFFNEISDAAIDVHLKFGEQLPTGLSTMHLYPIDGAASRVSADATAFAYRDGGWAGVIVGVDPDPANAGFISQWAKDYWQELHPTSAGGAYVNFMMNEGQDRIKAAYRGNYNRLAQIKRRYDPDNTFHINQNIDPASP